MPTAYDLLVIGDANPDVVLGPLAEPLAFGRREQLTDSGSLTATSGRDVPGELFAASRHVHAASYFPQPKLAEDLPEPLRAARAHGATTSLDTQDDPSGRWDGAALDAVLAETDILLPNAQEAMRLAGPTADTPRQAAAVLAGRVPLVAVKNGSDDALCHDGRTLMSAPGIPVTPTDTVGAGDSFDAGFIAATLQHQPPHQALRFAAVCGALSTRAHGGTAAQPTWDEALNHLSPIGALTS
ncbi:carbohydrate kinase family protein [Streptomyces sp. NPDC050610]|uniref:carbohydrate kinase family protein n=1 Tax=Streptomyces sp. NPDC050610 TaxID=3157097 RepID=UPI00341A0EF2